MSQSDTKEETKEETPQPTLSAPLLDFAHFCKYSTVFLETGTGRLGGTMLAIEAGYHVVKTCEASPEYHHLNLLDMRCYGFGTYPVEHHVECKRGPMLVELHNGKSVDRLPAMLRDVKGRMVCWLDAHVSGERSAGWDDFVAKGKESEFEQDHCLTKEIEILLQHRNDHILLLDDQNGFNPENKRYMERLLRANPNYTFTFYDEQRGNSPRYANKVLACVPT